MASLNGIRESSPMQNVTVTVRMPRRWTMRFWAGTLLIRLGVWIATMNYKETCA